MDELPFDPFEGPSNAPLSPEDTNRLRAHVDELCREHNVTLTEQAIDVSCASAVLDTHEVFVPPIASELTYLVALHEIGHLVRDLPSHECNDDGVEERLFANEATVWEWAIDQSLDAPSEDAVVMMVRLLTGPEDPGTGVPQAVARVQTRAETRRSSQ